MDTRITEEVANFHFTIHDKGMPPGASPLCLRIHYQTPVRGEVKLEIDLCGITAISKEAQEVLGDFIKISTRKGIIARLINVSSSLRQQLEKSYFDAALFI